MNKTKEYESINEEVRKKFELRYISQEEAMEAVEIEQICFPPHEACSEKNMKARVEVAPMFFLVAIDRTSGKIAGFLNGLATDEISFRDEFFTDASLHNPDGDNIMILGLDVLPEYRKQGLAKELMFQYFKNEDERGRKNIFLTCLEEKVEMYEKMGYKSNGVANSAWGAEQWYEMIYKLNR